MRRLGVLLAMVIALSVPTASSADDLEGAEELLCTAVQATVCHSHGECETGAPWNWNVPQFIRIDLNERMLSTTEASGENRQTPVDNFLVDEGVIFLQGIELGRAFSFVIEEASGFASIAVARAGMTVTVFGACTPLEAFR